MAGIVRALCFAAALAAGTAAAAFPARADAAKLEAALALFNEAALWRDSGMPGGGALFATGGVFRLSTGLRALSGATRHVREVRTQNREAPHAGQPTSSTPTKAIH